MSGLLASVVIPTYNRKEILKKVLDGLAVQSFHHDRFEVIVVDDASADGTETYVKANCELCDIRLTYIRQSQNRGPAAARNVGVRAARGDLVIFLDDDIVPVPHWMMALTTARDHYGLVDAVMGHVEFARELQRDPLIRFLTRVHPKPNYRGLTPGQKVPHYRFQVGNLAIGRDALFAVGLLDEEYKRPMGEDYELGYRLAQMGSSLYYEPRALGHHYHPTSFESHCRLKRLHGENAVFHSRRFPEYDHDLHGAAYDQAHPLSKVVQRGELARRAPRWLARHLVLNPPTARIARKAVRLQERIAWYPGINYLFRFVFAYEYYHGMRMAVKGVTVQ